MNFVRILDLKNEIEAGLLDAVLTEKTIPHLIRSMHDSAFDGAYQGYVGWGWVEAPEEERHVILAVYKDMSEHPEKYEVSEEEERTENGPGNKVRVVKMKTSPLDKTLIAVSVALLGALVVFAVENSRLSWIVNQVLTAHASINGTINYQWDSTENAYLGHEKETGKILSRTIDSDGNGSFETTIRYRSNGIKWSETIDSDGNSSHDHYRSFAGDGSLISEAFDTDGNLEFDKWINYYPAGQKAVWLDTDDDGVAETLEIHRKNGRVETVDVQKTVLGF